MWKEVGKTLDYKGEEVKVYECSDCKLRAKQRFLDYYHGNCPRCESIADDLRNERDIEDSEEEKEIKEE